MYPRSMADSDCVIVMGSNMAENHPVAFRWAMQAKVEHGAKLIHVDPRFTRTSAVADIYAPVRAGADIAFLGGLIHHVINRERWNSGSVLQGTWVTNYTNAATIINEEFRDAEDNDGVFSGLWHKGGIQGGRTTALPRVPAKAGSTRDKDRRSGPSGGDGAVRGDAAHQLGDGARGYAAARWSSVGNVAEMCTITGDRPIMKRSRMNLRTIPRTGR